MTLRAREEGSQLFQAECLHTVQIDGLTSSNDHPAGMVSSLR